MENNKLTIGIATKDRPQELARLLNSIKESKGEDFPVRILIADNSKNKNAKTSIPENIADEQFLIDWIHVKKRGIPIVRNAIIDESKNFEYLCFIDDDQVVAKGSVSDLIHLMDENIRIDIVRPLVREKWPANTPKYMVNENVCKRELKPYTNGVFLRVEKLLSCGTRFREERPMIGGTDSQFFEELVEHGAVCSVSNRLILYEVLPGIALEPKYHYKRAYFQGYNQMYWARYRGEFFFLAYLRILKWILRGLRELIFGVFTVSRKHIFLGKKRIFNACGGAAFLMGKSRNMYGS